MPISNQLDATEVARARVNQLAKSLGDELEVIAELTKEVDLGWLFFYNTAEFLRTRNPVDALAGNGPLLVTREGDIVELPSAISWERALAQIPRPAAM